MNERPEGFDKKKPPTAAEAFREAQRAEQVMRSSQYGSGQGGVFSGQKAPQKAEKSSRRDRMLAKLAAAITEALGERIESVLASQSRSEDQPKTPALSPESGTATTGGKEGPELRSPLVNNPPQDDEPITIGVNVGPGVPSVEIKDASPNWQSDTPESSPTIVQPSPQPEPVSEAQAAPPAVMVPEASTEQYVQPWEPQAAYAETSRQNALPEVEQGSRGGSPAEVQTETFVGSSPVPVESSSLDADTPQVTSPVASVDVEKTPLRMEQPGLGDTDSAFSDAVEPSRLGQGVSDPVMVGVNVDVDLPSTDEPGASGEWSPPDGVRPPSLAGIPDSELPDMPGALRSGEPMRTLDDLPNPEKQSWEPRSDKSPAQREMELDEPEAEPFSASSQQPSFQGSVAPAETVSFDQYDPPGRTTVDVQGRQPLEMNELVRDFAESNQLLHEATASSVRSIIAAMQTLSEELYQVSTAMDRLEDTYR